MYNKCNFYEIIKVKWINHQKNFEYDELNEIKKFLKFRDEQNFNLKFKYATATVNSEFSDMVDGTHHSDGDKVGR